MEYETNQSIHDDAPEKERTEDSTVESDEIGVGVGDNDTHNDVDDTGDANAADVSTELPRIVEERVAILDESLHSDRGFETVLVDESNSGAPISQEERQRQAKAKDKRRLIMRNQGYSDEQIDRLLPYLIVNTGRQRHLPEGSTVCSPELVAFFDGRSDEQIIQDAIKGIRNDGGTLGPVGKYARIIRANSNPDSAAQIIASEVKVRIQAIRLVVVSTVNELKRREAASAGRDVLQEKYLVVR